MRVFGGASCRVAMFQTKCRVFELMTQVLVSPIYIVARPKNASYSSPRGQNLLQTRQKQPPDHLGHFLLCNYTVIISQPTWQLGVVFPFETDVFGGGSLPLSRLPPGVLDVNVARRSGNRFMCNMYSVNKYSYERRHSKMERADDEYWWS